MINLCIQFPVIYQGETRIRDDQRQKLFEAIGWLNTFLEGHEYVAGTQNPSVADISLFNSVASIVVSQSFDICRQSKF